MSQKKEGGFVGPKVYTLIDGFFHYCGRARVL